MKAKEILSITAALICVFASVLLIIGAWPFQMAEEALSAAAEAFIKCANKIADGFNDAK